MQKKISKKYSSKLYWKNKTVLITGINGFIGSNLGKLLVSLDANIIGITNDKNKNGRNRTAQTLFINATDLGVMETRVNKILVNEDIQKISDLVNSWRTGKNYKDIIGFCKSSDLDEIKKNDFILTPGRYVGFKEDKFNPIDLNKKIKEIKKNLHDNFEESENLNLKIKDILNFLS